MRNILFSAVLVCVLTWIATAAANADVDSHQSISRQAAVVRAVGVVRYFHPHDAVIEVDWNRVLTEGFALVDRSDEDDDATFSKELAALLGRLGNGIVHRDGSDGTPPPAPECPEENASVRWVHEGFGTDPAPPNTGPYRSWRTGVVPEPDPTAFSTAMKDLPARDWRDQTLVFGSDVRLPEGGEAALWVRINDAEGNLVYFENMDEGRISDTEWAAHDLQFEVPENADRMAFGLLVHGPALAEFRDVRLQRVDDSAEETGGDSLLPDPGQWMEHSAGVSHAFAIKADDERLAVRLVPEDADIELPAAVSERLAEAPTATAISLPGGSLLEVPMVLCLSQTQASDSDREPLHEAFPLLDVESLSPDDRARLDVAVLWPVLQHFYPYQDHIDGWNDALDTALAETRLVEDAGDHERLLQRMMSSLNDGHVRIYHADEDPDAGIAWVPIAVESVDGELVVSRADSGTHRPDGVRPGDRIAAIDGEPASQWLERELAHHSGSLAWRTHRAIEVLLRGPRGESLALELLRDGQRIQHEPAFEQPRRQETLAHPPSTTLDGGIVYVKLHGMPAETQAELIPELVEAPGVILDLRGYPRADALLTHLLEEPDDWLGWMRVLLARAPNGDLVVRSEYEWGMQPAEPRIESPVVLLTNHRALSYSESIVGIVKRHGLATVVGSNTGGANGNVIALQLPSGFVAHYTGMHVLGPDGQPYHATGIEPDVHVAPTIQGLKDGRDEVLERALELFE